MKKIVLSALLQTVRTGQKALQESEKENIYLDDCVMGNSTGPRNWKGKNEIKNN